MSEERTQVLRMVSEGKISIEDADRLLDALERRSETPQPEEPAGLVERIVEGVLGRILGTPKAAEVVAQMRTSDRWLAENPDLAAVVRLHEEGVDPDYVTELVEQGVKVGVEDIIRLHDEGVDADYVARFSPKLSIDAIIRLHDEGIDEDEVTAYMDALARIGRTVDVERIVELHTEGVEPENVDA